VNAEIKAGRRTVTISRADKLLFADGLTKEDLARYYGQIAEVMLPHIVNRPLTLERYPDGIEGERILQKQASKYFPPWIARVVVPKKGGSVEHVRATDAASLVYLANQACIALHAALSRRDRLDHPDRLIIDLDPSSDRPTETRRAARIVGDLLRELGLRPWAMATGSRGYHVVVPLRRKLDFDGVRAFARELAAVAEHREPKLFTTEQRKAKRGDRVLLDVARNGYAQTAVAPYSVRPRPGAPVATPLHWDELSQSSTRSDRWTLRTVGRRLKADGDPWQEINARPSSLSEARRRLDAIAVSPTS
jgi:bifunctional non-homologous end joining protein LigD